MLFQGTTKSSAPRSGSLIILPFSVLRQTLWQGQIASKLSSQIKVVARQGKLNVKPPTRCGLNRTEVLCLSSKHTQEEFSHKGDARQVEDVNSPMSDPRQVSLPGLVDAILEVGRERKTLLDQLRSALKSGNDAEALRFARKLCGLWGKRE